MRLERASIVDGEPGYTQYCEASKNNQNITITLNGVPQKLCTAADAVKGWVRRAVVNEDGDITTDGENVLEEVVRGDVIIEVGEPPK
jgi:hypothetical protein